MIALEILIINEMFMVRSYISLFLGAYLSKISVQIVKNASSPFLFRNCLCILSSCFNESKKVLL